MAAAIRRGEDQHPDELTASKEQLLEQDRELDVPAVVRRQTATTRQCLEAQQLQFVEFNDRTTESLSRRSGTPGDPIAS